MKNLLCWESEDIKNLKLNARKVYEDEQISQETRILLEKILEPDFKVYNYFKDKLLKNVEQFGDIAMREGIEDLDRANTEITRKCDFKAADNRNLRDWLKQEIKVVFSPIQEGTIQIRLGLFFYFLRRVLEQVGGEKSFVAVMVKGS